MRCEALTGGLGFRLARHLGVAKRISSALKIEAWGTIMCALTTKFAVKKSVL